MRSDAADIKAELQARVFDLARELAPECRRQGKYWLGKNPMRADKHGGSFWVIIQGPAAGAWRDEATGEKGDVFGLIAATQGFNQFGDTLQWAKRWLNYEDVPAPQRAAKTAERAAEAAAREQQDRDEIAKARNYAFSRWLHAFERLRGTVAERYLATRGIDLEKLKRPPRALRFEVEVRHVESNAYFPAICALITGPDGKPRGIHRTFLAHDGWDKAPVKPTRKIWPRGWIGGCIPISRGETDMAPKEAAKHGLRDTLILCEGIEDGLSLALACPELRVWAAGTLGNLEHITIPECSDSVIVAADNDWGKPGAQAQLTKGVQALVAQGRSVRIARSHTGKDANDALRS